MVVDWLAGFPESLVPVITSPDLHGRGLPLSLRMETPETCRGGGEGGL